ncbi:hypothetical protein SJA_C1-33280 [Sphingobium indicum UT26S]|uniref:Uncharacterized protein n=1 Tax=Sphingobium indicum (strain DSM 16413 / CCM 7287 / MTCC 6362 / UT26 / NBRC 101211 / UT26S) TaxID=452662 RepID=D4Z6D0_SPHIU|nr:hypothetical protein SJA_C1-33280 [Sphingobium indicum UT26S]
MLLMAPSLALARWSTDIACAGRAPLAVECMRHAPAAMSDRIECARCRFVSVRPPLTSRRPRRATRSVTCLFWMEL